MKTYYVYIMASSTCTLYTGVTSDLARRVYEHKNGLLAGFARRYGITRLVYCEATDDVYAALQREKQIKRWRRAKKVDLIESVNPNWDDLSCTWRL
ncbi:MAG TPA: GIY-YIG nuclease family protein [Armatimonadota bacterium]|nr:GIY-YIG nuclease family protein [Armatimonadota bacterium]